MIRLRAHHLLCLPIFKGKGYNSDFVRNMTSLAATLAADPKQEVRLVSGADDICLHCPHHRDDQCLQEGQGPEVAERDRRVLFLLELEAGECRPYLDLQKKLSSLFVHFSFQDICGACRWIEVCSRFAETKAP